MDFILPLLPSPIQSFYRTYYAPYTNYLHPFLKRSYLLAQSTFFNTVYPILYPVYALVSSRLDYETNSSNRSRSTDTTAPLLSLVIALLVLYVSVWSLNFLRRRLFALISTVVNLVFYAAILIFGIYVYNRGIEGTVSDITLALEFMGSLEKQGQKKGQRMAGQKSYEAQKKGYGYTGSTLGAGRQRYR
ncbi:MAG: hypothetical protein LQ340_000387 [Diploschistes diacapsis]|nr:MAG: hypothetical protein LQ340_000387 [Diploschistes diacapsis]